MVHFSLMNEIITLLIVHFGKIWSSILLKNQEFSLISLQLGVLNFAVNEPSSVFLDSLGTISSTALFYS